MTMAMPVSDGNLRAPSAPIWIRARAHAAAQVDRVTRRLTVDAPVLEGALRRLDDTLSLRSIRARVVEVRAETHDVNTYVLRPNARFKSFQPGSFVNIKLRIDGKSVQRSYSISSAPSPDGLFAITVKRVEGGLVSNWLADNVKPGFVLPLSAPQGQFVLPSERPDALLMLSAGSGITPVMSMLRQLAREEERPITFVHFARSPQDLIFHDELQRIAQFAPHVKLVFCVEQGDASWQGLVGRFTQELLGEVAPNFRELDTFMCGPSGFMKAVVKTLEETGAELSRLRYERFGADFDASAFIGHGQLVRFAKSGGESMSTTPRTILDEAERLGINVEWGCRAGNCGTCRCKKFSGVVTDITTGLESGPGEDFILPCVSIPRGAVEVEL
ncbi:MAG: hybrid-cluster NAD(P)-dependent oxidoreductase [Polyangiales bacterium]